MLVSHGVVSTFLYYNLIPVLSNGTCFMQLKVNKTCPKKSPLSLEVQLNHPLTMASLHEAVRSCNLKHWILIVDPKNCWQSRRLYNNIYSFSFVGNYGKRLWIFAGRQGAVNWTLECAFVLLVFNFLSVIPVYLLTTKVVEWKKTKKKHCISLEIIYTVRSTYST